MGTGLKNDINNHEKGRTGGVSECGLICSKKCTVLALLFISHLLLQICLIFFGQLSRDRSHNFFFSRSLKREQIEGASFRRYFLNRERTEGVITNVFTLYSVPEGGLYRHILDSVRNTIIWTKVHCIYTPHTHSKGKGVDDSFFCSHT